MGTIKVLIVAGTMGVGGIENQMMHLLRNADKNKFQIDFTSTIPNAYYRTEIEELGGTYIQIPHMGKHIFRYCKSLYGLMKQGKYDIVHSQELFHSGIVLAVARAAGVKCRIAHAHNWRDDNGVDTRRSLIRSVYNIIMRRLIVQFSTVQIACSTWAGRFLYGNKVLKKDSYYLVFNSVDTSKFLVNYEKQEMGEFCEDEWINILNVARITAVKNQKFLVELAEEFHKRGKKIRILCAGNGDEAYENEIRNLLRKKHLEEYLLFLGVRDDIDVLMRKSQAFILPSKYEGMPLVMIEAQAAGMRCISADTYSPEVDFGIGLIRWLSLNDDIAVWADTVEEAINKGRPTKEDVENAVRKRRFDSKMFAETICEIYENDYRTRNGEND